MSISDQDRKWGIDLIVSSVLREGSTSEEKRQIALRLAQRKENDVFETSGPKGVAQYKQHLVKLCEDIMKIKASEKPAALTHGQDVSGKHQAAANVIEEYWKVHAEITEYSSLVAKLIVRQETKVKSLPPEDQRVGGEERKLADLLKIQNVMKCKRGDPGIDERLDTRNPERCDEILVIKTDMT